jgi:hypothetical protein
MQTTTYQYVFYSAFGSHTRQPRSNPSATFVNIPGATEPSPISLVLGSMFQASPAPASYPGSGGITYEFAFMNVSGLAEGGRTSYNSAVPPPAGTVGTANINVLVVYVETGGGGSGPTAATIDAFDETKGTLVDDTFVNVVNQNGSANPVETKNGNVDGYVDTANAEIIQAYPLINPDNGTFDKWGIFYQGNPATSVSPATPTQLNVAAGDEPYAFALYRSPVVLPCPYVTGGIHSADIVLYDLTTGLPITATETNGDSALQPDTLYGLAAIVHNDTAVDCINTDVSFWEIPGGTGTAAVLLNTQRITLIPAYSTVEVRSAVNFTSGSSPAYPSTHNCAGVSVYNYISGCCNNATTAAEFNALSNNSGQPGCVAWRNTDTMWVFPGLPFHIRLGLGESQLIVGPDPVQIQVQTKHVPLGWQNESEVKKLAGVLKAAGARINSPLYLLPDLQHTLKEIDLEPKVTIKGNGKLKEKDQKYSLDQEKGKSTEYEVSGKIPATAKTGEVFLVTVTAHYPPTKGVAAKSVGFLEVLLVTDKISKK